MFRATVLSNPHLPLRKVNGSNRKFSTIFACSDSSFLYWSSLSRLDNIVFFAVFSSSKGGVFQVCRCMPISHRPSSMIPLNMEIAVLSVATGYEIR
jgi:hypothetical protein